MKSPNHNRYYLSINHYKHKDYFLARHLAIDI